MSSKTDTSAESNPAVFRCMEAWRQAYDTSLNEGESEDTASDAADRAYLDAMPPLLGIRNIRNFIACVTHACLIGTIDGQDTARLLYAAQVAHSTRRTRTKEPKTARSRAKQSHSGAIQGGKKAIQEPSSESVRAKQVAS